MVTRRCVEGREGGRVGGVLFQFDLCVVFHLKTDSTQQNPCCLL